MLDDTHGWFHTSQGMAALCLLGGIVGISLVQVVTGISRRLFRPAVEQAFYHQILTRWLGPFFSRHQIMATFIRLNGYGDALVDLIVCLIASFWVVALLSSAITAALMLILQGGFVFSWPLWLLISLAVMLLWILIRHIRYLYRLAYRIR